MIAALEIVGWIAFGIVALFLLAALFVAGLFLLMGRGL